jgi:DNA polymerase II large subunit
MRQELLLKTSSLQKQHGSLHCTNLFTECLVVHTNLRVFFLPRMRQNIVQVSVQEFKCKCKGATIPLPAQANLIPAKGRAT